MFSVQIIHDSYEYAYALACRLENPRFDCRVVDISTVGFIGIRRFRTRKPDIIIFDTLLTTMTVSEFCSVIEKLNKKVTVIFIGPEASLPDNTESMPFRNYCAAFTEDDTELLGIFDQIEKQVESDTIASYADPGSYFEAIINASTHGEVKYIVEDMDLPKPNSFARLMLLALREECTSGQMMKLDNVLHNAGIGRAFFLPGNTKYAGLLLSNASPITDDDLIPILKRHGFLHFAGISCDYLPVVNIRSNYREMYPHLPRLYFLQDAAIIQLRSLQKERPLTDEYIQEWGERVLNHYCTGNGEAIDEALSEMYRSLLSTHGDHASLLRTRRQVSLLSFFMEALIHPLSEDYEFPRYDRFMRLFDEYEYCRALFSGLKTQKDQKKEDLTSLVESAMVFIDKNLRKTISLSDVSAALNISKEYLSSEFSRQMNCRMTEYINNRKLIVCIHNICSGRKHSEAASYVGFTDVKYFERLFKKAYGVTPNQYKTIMNEKIGEVE